MPKNRKEALEKYFRDAGARTAREQQELWDNLGWKVIMRRGKTEVLASEDGGALVVRRLDEDSVKPELRTDREQVTLGAEAEENLAPLPEDAPVVDESPSERPGEPTVDPTPKGGRNGA